MSESKMDLIRKWESAVSGRDLPAGPTRLTAKQRALRSKLLREECDEVIAALEGGVAASALAKELADLVYVAYGIAAQSGIDLDRSFEVVHASNMSKVAPDGTFSTRSDGKVLKGPFYRAPDFSWLQTEDGAS